MMYNEKQKMEFINYLPESNNESMKVNLINLFKKLNRKVEAPFGKDFCEMNYREVELGITLLGGRTVASISWNLSRLKSYYDWCINNGRTNVIENPLALIKPSEIDNSAIYRVEMIKSPEHLSYLQDIVYPHISEDRVSNVFRLYMWLLYNGLTGNEAVSLQKNDIDLDNKIININRKYNGYNKIKMLPETNMLLDNILSLKYFVTNKFGKENLEVPVYDSPLVLNTTIAPALDMKKAWAMKISFFNVRYKNETNEYIKISPNRIFDSGVFYRWYQDEIKGKNIDEMIIDHVNFITYGKDYSNPNHIVRDYYKSRLLKSYEMWKKAFDYI